MEKGKNSSLKLIFEVKFPSESAVVHARNPVI